MNHADPDEVAEHVDLLAVRASVDLGFECAGSVVDSERLGPIGSLIPTSGQTGEVTALWRWCRQQSVNGFWPVILVDETWEEVEEFAEMDPYDLVAEADELDASTLLRDRARLFAGVDDLSALSFGDEPPSAAPATAESVDLAGAIAGNDPAVYLFPAATGWQVASLLALADGGQYEPSEHVAILRYFETRYTAALAATSGAISFLVLDEPVTGPTLTHEAAIERIGYADTTFGAHEYDREEVRAATKVDTVWGFWWD